MQTIEIADVECIARVLGDAGNPRVEMPLVQRNRIVLEGVAELINADVWMWSTSVPNPERVGDVSTTCLIDGGWMSDREQVGIYQVLTDPSFAHIAQRPIVEAFQNKHYRTFCRSDIFSDTQWETLGEKWRAAGFDDLLLTVYPLTEEVYSGVAFHRRLGKPRYTERERAIVHVVLQQVDWLHRDGVNEPANRTVVRLTPRERQVLVFLLSGNSLKQIAEKLGISEHTVNDYTKQLHKRFEVNSRAELQGFFLSGGHRNSKFAEPPSQTLDKVS